MLGVWAIRFCRELQCTGSIQFRASPGAVSFDPPILSVFEELSQEIGKYGAGTFLSPENASVATKMSPLHLQQPFTYIHETSPFIPEPGMRLPES